MIQAMYRLEEYGWVTSSWEKCDPHEVGRPRRRYYKLTADGMELASDLIREAWAFMGQPFPDRGV